MDRHQSPVSPELSSIFLSLACGGTALLATVALAACGVRLIWPEAEPLPAAASLSIALLTAAWCASIRAAWLAASPQKFGNKLHALIAAIPCCSVILIARSVTFYPVGEFATFLLWFATLAQEAITLSLFISTLGGDTISQWLSRVTNSTETQPAESSEIQPIVPMPISTNDFLSEEEDEEQEMRLADHVTQQLTRAIEANQEQIHGLVRATFTPGQRHAYLHIGFCPPLPSVPQVELHQLEGEEVQIKAGQVLTSGVRFDLKLREASIETRLPVFEFLATSPVDAAEQFREAC